MNDDCVKRAWVRNAAGDYTRSRRLRNDFVVCTLIGFRYQPRMELRHLRYFVAVAEDLSFRRAAERLRVAQPALSKQIRDLEQELGARLLDRNTAGVRLTDAGAVLLADARELLRAAHKLSTTVREAAEGRRGRLTIGNVGAISAAFLPASLTAFRQRFPDVDVTLREMRSSEQLAALIAGQIQIGLLVGAEAPDRARFESRRVARSPMRAFMAKNHALAKQASLNIRDLSGETFLATAPSRSANEHVEVIRNVFGSRELAVPPVKAVDGLESLLALIAAGHGISLLPAAISVQRSLGLVTKPLSNGGADLAFSVWITWRRNDDAETIRNFVRLTRPGKIAHEKTPSALHVTSDSPDQRRALA